MCIRDSRTIALDYGTTNPCVYLDIYDDGDVIWVDREYRWDSRVEKKQKTDSQYADDMVDFMGSNPDPVSYTHLDVYKRQGSGGAGCRGFT